MNKGGRGRVLFFFIIFIVNICLGKKKCRFYFETNWFLMYRSKILWFFKNISAFFILNEASPGVSRYLLLILGANMAVYMTFYACMKYYYVMVEERYANSTRQNVLIHVKLNFQSPRFASIEKLFVDFRLCESITRTCLIYCFLALAFNMVGMYFFVVETKNTLTSPAISRHKNADCFFLFYDK